MSDTPTRKGPIPSRSKDRQIRVRGDSRVFVFLEELAASRGVYLSDVLRSALKSYAVRYGYREE